MFFVLTGLPFMGHQKLFHQPDIVGGLSVVLVVDLLLLLMLLLMLLLLLMLPLLFIVLVAFCFMTGLLYDWQPLLFVVVLFCCGAVLVVGSC